jgi:hypothetical protein
MISPLDRLLRLFGPEERSQPQHLLRAKEMYDTGQLLLADAAALENRDLAFQVLDAALCLGEDAKALAGEWKP